VLHSVVDFCHLDCRAAAIRMGGGVRTSLRVFHQENCGNVHVPIAVPFSPAPYVL
jgi:hypothetical protein